MKTVEFWLSIGSPYTYLTVMRLTPVVAKTGLHVVWRPFSARQIMQEMAYHPYLDKPVRTAHMWTDIGRQARKIGLSPRLPAPFPILGYELANRVAIVAAEEGWVADYVPETYRRWFHHGQPAGQEPNLSKSLVALGQDPDRVIALAEGRSAGQAFEAATREARDRGVFDTPSFIVDNNIYYGDDRLADALRHAIPAVPKEAGVTMAPGRPAPATTPVPPSPRLRQGSS